MVLRSLARDVVRVLGIVGPTALANALEYLPVLITIGIVGHHTSSAGTAAELDAVALARAYFNAVALSPGFGYITALRTLMPQAVGAGRPELLPLHLQRAVLLVVAGALPTVPLLYFADRLLVLAGQPPEVAALAQPYALRLLPYYFGYVLMSAVQRVYQALEYNWSNFVITAVACAASPLLTWALVEWSGAGYLGAAWSASAVGAIYLAVQVPHLCWLGLGRLFAPQPLAQLLAPRPIGEHLKLMAPGFLMTCAEWWVQELVVLLAGLLRDPGTAIGAWTVLLNVQAMFVMAWIGLAVATATLVGQRIGAGDVPGARRMAAVTVGVGLALAGALGGALALGASPLAAALTTVPAIDALAARLLPLLAAALALDATNNALGGVCSGLGLQRYAAAAQLIGYYAVGVPAGAALAYGYSRRELLDGSRWLWGGIALAMLTAALLQLAALCRHDWRRAAAAAQARLALDAEGGAASGSSQQAPLGQALLLNTDAQALPPPAPGEGA